MSSKKATSPTKVVELVNISPLGALNVPLAGQIVQAGATFTVPAEVANILLRQPRNFQPAKPVNQVGTPINPEETTK